MRFFKSVTVVCLFVGFGCMRSSPPEFEQQVREAWPQVSHCLGVVAQAGFDCKKGDQFFNPVSTIAIFLRSHPQYWDNPGDLFYINTNKCYWLDERIAKQDVAILKKIVNEDNPLEVLYVGETYGSQKIIVTNLVYDAVIPVYLGER